MKTREHNETESNHGAWHRTYSDVPCVLADAGRLALSGHRVANAGEFVSSYKWKSWVDLPLGVALSSTSLEGPGPQSLPSSFLPCWFTSQVAPGLPDTGNSQWREPTVSNQSPSAGWFSCLGHRPMSQGTGIQCSVGPDYSPLLSTRDGQGQPKLLSNVRLFAYQA